MKWFQRAAYLSEFCVVALLSAIFSEVIHADDAKAPAEQTRAAAMMETSVQLRELLEADWVARDREFVVREYAGKGIAARQEAEVGVGGVSTADDAAGGCDGIKDGRLGFHTASQEVDPWWQVDLGRLYRLDRIVIYNRTDGKAAPRTRHIRVLVDDDAEGQGFRKIYQHDGTTFLGVKEKQPLVVDLKQQRVSARIVRLQIPGRCSFALDEVEVYALGNPGENIALGKPADQKSISPYSRPSRRVVVEAQPAPEPGIEDTFSLTHTRHVIRQAQGLAKRLAPVADAQRLDPLVPRLAQLDRRLADLEKGADIAAVPVRKTVYLEARQLARKIAFCNPVLDFNKILFVKRHHPGGLYHMVHQYYGFGAKPGGGLFVLSDPFSDDPKLTNLLGDAPVTSGRLKGRALTGGAFLSPDLSYDGQSVLFAYTQCEADGIEWSPRSSFHVFRVRADGSGLAQLTDGKWNDFDPCFLPNGRVVFVSERRGGYLRCGGSAPPYDSPTYTLHSMEADGSDIICLSYHDTQEWQPSVTNNGMLAYSRWDYVDRDTNIAHHIWTCFPDGRDPRSFHGNYPTRRESRPWMEMSIRAVPGSHKFVATAAAHHGHAFGSLVLIDPHVPDDGAMSQLTRLTPDVPFPESEGGKGAIRQHMRYGTAWPLSEDDFLCAYDTAAENHGLYWIDRFGNKELLYRDSSIPSLSPIPFRPRPEPPLLPDQTVQAAAAIEAAGAVNEPAATVGVVNVYESDFDWPPETKITHLRIVQVLPKTTPPSNKPRIGVGNQTNARAVLGSVPVEEDGSAYFEVPPGKLIYFQALDGQGMAVQSMRSGTYLHPGERLTCHGCHEPKTCAPSPPFSMPLAWQRPPSKLQPDVEGSNPFNYVRLVQGVLDRNCVECHERERALDLSGDVVDPHGWTKSYSNLAGEFGFFYHVSNGSINSGVHGGSRSIAGKFGAKAAPLLKYLAASHHGVKLSDEDFHRITLWLDCNCEFFGAYENTTAQSHGETVLPALD